MKNVQTTYANFHKKNQSVHMYPTEWVVRTFLGGYPNLKLNKDEYLNSKILDLGFGDCRNMPLLHNCGFDIYGVEISDDIISMANEKLFKLGISGKLKKGSNANVPFDDNYFDYLLACHSCYYVDEHTSFKDNLDEMSRVIKANGTIIVSVPAPGNFILKDCERLEDGHVIIRNDIFGLRNGYIFRTFEDEKDVEKTFSAHFKNLAICHCLDNFWGLQINFFLIVGKRNE